MLHKFDISLDDNEITNPPTYEENFSNFWTRPESDNLRSGTSLWSLSFRKRRRIAAAMIKPIEEATKICVKVGLLL